MARYPLRLDTLAKLEDGRIEKAFRHALQRCRDDCEDRPAVDKERTVTLVVKMVPIPGDRGELDSVDVTCDVKDNVPRRSSRAFNMAHIDGELVFNDLAPEDAHQRTLDEAPGNIRPLRAAER